MRVVRQAQITHRADSEGIMRQIVTPHQLRRILDLDGDDYSRPSYFREADEWKVEGKR